MTSTVYVTELPAELTSLAGLVTGAIQALRSLDTSDEPAAAKALKVLDAARSVLDAVQALEAGPQDLAALPYPFEVQETWAALARALPSYLFSCWLESSHPIAHACSSAVGGVRANGQGGLEVDFAALAELAAHPGSALASRFAADPGALLLPLAKIAAARGTLQPAQRLILQGASAAALEPPRPRPALPGFRASLASAVAAAAGAVDLDVAPLADGSPGLSLLTSANGPAAASIDLGGGWSAACALDPKAAAGFAWTPSGLAPATEADGGSLAILGAPETPWTLLGSASATRLELRGLRFDLGGTSLLSEPAVEASAATEGLRLVIAPGDGDAFLRDVLGSQELVAEGALSITWSKEEGLRVGGGEGFDLTLPIDRTVGPLQIDLLHLLVSGDAGALSLSIGISAGFSLGPFSAAVEELGLAASLSPAQQPGLGALGDLDFAISFKPPTGLGLALDLGAIGSGGGFLDLDPDEGQYAGAAALELFGVGIGAVGVLATVLPGGASGWSLFLSLSAIFRGLPLGFGFTLNGVGGLVGVNRAVDAEALGDGVRSGALDGLLFPDDPIADAPRILADLDAVFPPALGQCVFGPVAQIGWGAPTMATASVGIVLQLPDPLTVSLLGSVEALLPTAEAAILALRVDVAGTLDLTAGSLSVDASLRGSQVAGLALTGDMALRARFLDAPTLLMAFGGFNPRFVPPADFPALDRLAVGLDTGDDLRLQLAGYFAATSNTVQFGASASLWAQAIGLIVEGEFEVDALLDLHPFGFAVDLGFMVSVSAGQTQLLGAALALTFQGPDPWYALGAATVVVLGIKKDFRVEAQLGPAKSDAAAEAVDVVQEVVAALGDPSAWSAAPPPADAAFGLLGPGGAGPGGSGALRLHPAGALEVRQRVAPIDRPIDHFGGDPLAAPLTVTLDAPTLGGAPAPSTAIDDWFAAAQFFAMTDEEKLSAPSFEQMPCGLRIAGEGFDAGPAAPLTPGYEQIIRDPEARAAERAPTALFRPTAAAIANAVRASPAARERGAAGLATSAARPSPFALAPVRYVVAEIASGAVDGALTPAGGVEWSRARVLAAEDRGLQIAPSYEPAVHVEAA